MPDLISGDTSAPQRVIEIFHYATGFAERLCKVPSLLARSKEALSWRMASCLPSATVIFLSSETLGLYGITSLLLSNIFDYSGYYISRGRLPNIPRPPTTKNGAKPGGFIAVQPSNHLTSSSHPASASHQRSSTVSAARAPIPSA